MDKSDLNLTLLTAGGNITCNRCTAKSKRSGEQCKKPALRTSRIQKCQFHGGRSTGPKTEKGRLNIALAKTQHGGETRQARIERSAMSAKLLAMEDILFLINAATGTRTRGRKPATYTPITTLEDAIAYIAANPITS
jgi:hypothetical protein